MSGTSEKERDRGARMGDGERVCGSSADLRNGGAERGAAPPRPPQRAVIKGLPGVTSMPSLRRDLLVQQGPLLTPTSMGGAIQIKVPHAVESIRDC